ncbi:MAG: hypothetical protein ACRDFW_05975 [bacterium]
MKKDVPWAKVTITPEAVDRVSELAVENARLRAALERIATGDYSASRYEYIDIARAALEEEA